MKWRSRLLLVGTLLLVLIVWSIFMHNPGFRKYPRHDSVVMGGDEESQKRKEEHPTLVVKVTDEVLPVDNEFQVKGSKRRIETTLKASSSDISYPSVWNMWRKWPSSLSILPENAFESMDLNRLLTAMAEAPINSFDVGYKGTQLKATVVLEGGQMVVFKPKRYNSNVAIKGDPYAGFDRHDGEIAAFHLDGILGFNMAPPVVGRRIDLEYIKPVISDKLRKTFFFNGSDTCFYGVCYYCKRSEAACADGTIIDGSLTIWLPSNMKLKTWRHPYQRTYRPTKARWEQDEHYCKDSVMLKPPYNSGPRLLDVTETALFDFVTDNADRHHYETFEADGLNGRILHLDNGKGFRNPYRNEMSILEPIKQCCKFRRTTWERLKLILEDHNSPLSERLRSRLRKDPLSPVLHPDQLQVIDSRFKLAMRTVQDCIDKHGQDSVLL